MRDGYSVLAASVIATAIRDRALALKMLNKCDKDKPHLITPGGRGGINTFWKAEQLMNDVDDFIYSDWFESLIYLSGVNIDAKEVRAGLVNPLDPPIEKSLEENVSRGVSRGMVRGVAQGVSRGVENVSNKEEQWTSRNF